MSDKSYNESKIIAVIRKRNIQIDENNKVIYIPKNSINLGLSILGKIDFLVKFLGYKREYVDKTELQKEKEQERLNRLEDRKRKNRKDEF